MTHNWQAVFARALHKLGSAPGAQLEQQLIEHFQTNPQAVTNAIEKIIRLHDEGRVRSPWGALKTEVDRQVLRDLHVNDNTERHRALQSAEQWIRNAGKMFPTWHEALEELKKREQPQKGAPLQLTPSVLARLRTLWLEQRPIGEQIEAEHEAAMRRYRDQRETLNAKPKTGAIGEAA